MTVPTTASYVSPRPAGNGITTVFNFPFKILGSSDIVAGLVDVNNNYTGQSNGTDYIVTGIDVNTGGQITFAVPPPTGLSVDIRSVTASVGGPQPTSYMNQGKYLASSTEDSFDRITRIVQDILRQTYTFGIHGPDTELVPWTMLPSAAARANTGLVFDAEGLPTIGTIPTSVLTKPTIIGLLVDEGYLYEVAPAEAAVNITAGMLTFGFLPGDGRRYGTDPTGGVDSTAAINLALSCNQRVWVVGGSYLCSGNINVGNGQTLYGDGASTVLNYANGAISNIVMANVTGAEVHSLKIVNTGSVSLVKSGGVYMKQCTGCMAHHLEIVGMMWAGVWIDNANGNSVFLNYFHDFLGAQDSQADVAIYNAQSTTAGASYNIITLNRCMGGGHTGISIEDADLATATTGFASRNIVDSNIVKMHTAYGLLHYCPGNGAGPCDTFNKFTNNYVEGILGSFASNRDSGAGIYSVGNGSGGVTIANNQVVNCCSQTMTRSLAPAGIGINGVQTGMTPPTVTGNTVQGMTQGDCILVTSSPGGANVNGNTGNTPSTNLGTGVGGGSLLGGGVRVEASSNVTCANNNMQVFGAGSAYFLYANGINSTNCSFSGGSGQTSGAGPTFQVAQNNPTGGPFAASQFIVGDIKLNALGSGNAVDLAQAIGGYFSNVVANAVSGIALKVNGCAAMRFPSGQYTSGGSVSVSTSGTCTGSFLSKEVYWGGSDSLMGNAGSGFNVESRGSAAPSAGVWQTGDHRQFNPAAGGVPGAYCTTGGTSGTWKPEGVIGS